MLLSEQRCKLGVIFKTVLRRNFELLRYTSVCDIFDSVRSKPCDVLLEETSFAVSIMSKQ